MLAEIACITLGVPIGYALRKYSTAVAWGNRALSAVIYILLFLIGFSVGGNNEFLARLTELGVQGILIGILCALGSVLAVYILYAYICKKEN